MQENKYKGKRIAAIDFGNKRVGIAICDELHITVTPSMTLLYDKPDFWDKLVNFIQINKIAALIVGMPYYSEGNIINITNEIRHFISELKSRTTLDVIEFDESFSTKKAIETMIINGKRKKFRSKKENKDMFAAAIILKDFINEFYNNIRSLI